MYKNVASWNKTVKELKNKIKEQAALIQIMRDNIEAKTVLIESLADDIIEVEMMMEKLSRLQSLGGMVEKVRRYERKRA